MIGVFVSSLTNFSHESVSFFPFSAMVLGVVGGTGSEGG